MVSVASPITPAHALAVYVEGLVSGRRVAVLGDASLGLGEWLAGAGARLVHVYDPDAERARRSDVAGQRALMVRPLPRADFDVRDGAFDLVLVPDLTLFDDLAALLSRVRRVVSNDGALVAAAPNPDIFPPPPGRAKIDYYELFDAVSLQFAQVRMIGQVPFVGVALAELGESSESQVSVDTQLVTEPSAPEWFVALASQTDVRLEPYAIVQLPGGAAGEGAAEAQAANDNERALFAEMQLRAELLSSQLDEQRSLATRLSADAERAKRVDELEATLLERSTKLKDAEARAGDHYVRAERLTHDLRRLEEELQRHRDRATRLTKELEDEKRHRTRAEVDLGMVRKNPEVSASRERIAALEEEIREVQGALIAADDVARAAAVAMTERDATIVLLGRQVNALRESATQIRVDPEAFAELAALAERSSARAQQLEEEHAHLVETHGRELAGLEETLRDRARAIQALEQELVRRERIVQELLSAMEEGRASLDLGVEASAAAFAVEPGPAVTQILAPLDGAREAERQAAFAQALDEAASEVRESIAQLQDAQRQNAVVTQENQLLRDKLNALALEFAHHEGALRTAEWRVSELENQFEVASAAVAAAEARSAEAVSALEVHASDPIKTEAETARAIALADELSRAHAELAALRQALAQEHEAKDRFASGEELARAQSELARQAALIEQLSRELEAHDRGRMVEQITP